MWCCFGMLSLYTSVSQQGAIKWSIPATPYILRMPPGGAGSNHFERGALRCSWKAFASLHQKLLWKSDSVSFLQLSGLWNFPKLTREWGASGVRRRYTGECYEQKTIRNRKGADRLEKHWKEGRANEGDAVNRYLSFFLFVVSLLLVWTRGHSCPLSCRLSQCSFLWSKDQGLIWASFTSLNRGRGLWHD